MCIKLVWRFDIFEQVEQQGVQMEKVQQRNTVLMEENSQLKHRVESLDRSVTTETNTTCRGVYK